MKLREIVPRKLNIGDRVFYTHRASTSSGRDVQRLPWPLSMSEPPLRYATGRYAERARWVLVWPESGYGIVTGLTYRAEGIISPGYEDEQGYLGEQERFPLYEVKTALRGRPMLIPPWACVPLKWFGQSFVLAFDEVPESRDGHSFDEYVDVFLRTQPEKVTSA